AEVVPAEVVPAEVVPAEVAGAEVVPAEPQLRDRDDRTPSSDAFPVPTGPRTTGFGGHLLGILVGLTLAVFAAFFLMLGQARILSQGVGRSDVTPETLGIVLVTIGVLLAGGVILAGVWTPTAPLTGGLVLIALGAAYLFAPSQAHRETVRLISTEQNHLWVVNSITAATTGGLFLTGILLLAAATALSLVRRRGLALGAFREQARES
ncbi:MAG: hypothetical protein ACOH2F_20510, partial [Cellulomonas sp.]